MRELKVFLMIAACICLVGGLSSNAAAQAEDPIKIGAIGPMDFDFGKLIWYGAEMAGETINKAGGINVGGKKRPVKLVKINSNEMSSITDAVAAVDKAIMIDKVNCLVGTFRSEAGLAMQDRAMEAKIIFIGSGGAAPELNGRVKKDYDKYKYWFRVCFNQLYSNPFLIMHATYIADILKKELGLPKVTAAMLVDKAAWTAPAVAGFSKALPAVGIDVVKVIQVSPVATDVTAEMAALKESGAHMVIQFLSGPAGAVVARQAAELKIPIILTGINVLSQSKAMWEATGGKGEYITTGTLFARFGGTPTTEAFYDAFDKRYNELPAHGAFSHEGIMVYKEAIERAGTIDPDKVVAAMEKTDYLGAGYRIAFRGQEDPYPHDLVTKPGYALVPMVQWIKGKQVTIWPLEWEGVTYKGVEKFVVPPWMAEHYKK